MFWFSSKDIPTYEDLLNLSQNNPKLWNCSQSSTLSKKRTISYPSADLNFFKSNHILLCSGSNKNCKVSEFSLIILQDLWWIYQQHPYQRYQILKKAKLCFSCLGIYWLSRSSLENFFVKCYSNKHHYLLHNESSERK